MSYAVAVDIGGTFTDLVAYDHEDGKVVYAKSPTTYGNFVEGILDCFAKVKLEYTEQEAKGGKAATSEYTWDIQGNVKE